MRYILSTMTILWKNLYLIWDCGVTDLVYSGLWEYIKGRVLGVQRVRTCILKGNLYKDSKSVIKFEIGALFIGLTF